MSETYKRKLQHVQNERDTAQESVAYVRDNWYSKNIFNETAFIEGVTIYSIRQLLGTLDTIFTIRLFAAFEGMLREHMREHHPGIVVSEDAGAAVLIDQVAAAQRPKIIRDRCDDVHKVRQYRNSLMHPAGKVAAEIPFTEALARLALYVGWLPEPK